MVVKEEIEGVRGQAPRATGTRGAPESGIFIDIHTVDRSFGIVEIKQTVSVSQGLTTIAVGPNEVTKDPFAGAVIFQQGSTTKTKRPY